MPDGAYVDSCIFIHLLQRKPGKILDACQELIGRAERSQLVVVTSAWTITEVNKIDANEKDVGILEKDSKIILQLFRSDFIDLKPVTRAVAELAHELTRMHGLTNADAVHVATAVLFQVPVMHTYDAPKKKRRGLLKHNLKIGTPPLRIETPPDPLKGTLFEKTEETETGD